MKNILFSILLMATIIISGCSNPGSTSKIITWTCSDVTSYDHNWNNDMKCKSSAGEIKYTSYEGARVLESL